jgi:thioredoxin reductase (NADPH)
MDDLPQVAAKKVLLACGIQIKKLGVEGEDKYAGQGVYYSALTGDAAFYRDNDRVAIIGGGDTAGIAAIFFAKAEIKTVMIIRHKLRDTMLAVNYLEIEKRKDFIEVKEGADVAAFRGGDDGYLNKLEIKQTGQSIDVAAAYVLIGAQGLDKATKDWLNAFKVPFDNNGVKTAPLGGQLCFNMTTVPGLFVARDARAGSARRIIAAVGDGSSAALGIYNDFSTT